MTVELGDGVPIARLLGANGTQLVGRLYRWETGDLGIIWTSDDRWISFVDRKLDPDLLKVARDAGSAKLVDFLETLPAKN